MYARLRERPIGVKPEEDRLSYGENVVRVAAEHKAMAPLSFVLDGVIGGSTDQASAYAAVGAPAVEGLLRGESTTLVAFGATGAGKSYTLFGPPDLLSNPAGSSWQEWGILPRASHHLFSRASAVGGVEGLLGVGSTVSCSFMEIRDEKIHDLLGKGRDLHLRESAYHGVYVPSATKRLVEWEEDVMRALVLGLQKRSAVREDESMIQQSGGGGGSSRRFKEEATGCSHTIFTLMVSRKAPDGTIVESKLQLVDLGAAELPRPGSSATPSERSGQRKKPPLSGGGPLVASNLSLASLDKCIHSLADGPPGRQKPPSPGEPNPQNIPYRDSKLTWLLRDALGGGAGCRGVVHHTTFIAMCSAEPQYLPNSINSLRFAHRCRQARMWVPSESSLVSDLPELLNTIHEGDQEVIVVSDGGLHDHGPPSPEKHHDDRLRASSIGQGVTPLSPPLTGTLQAMQLGAEPDSDSSDDGDDEDSTQRDARLARSQEKADIEQKLAEARRAQPTVAASGPPPPVVGGVEQSDGWEELQSAHAHMLLLEARLAELSTPAH